jgi:hypothetical protein
MFARSVGFRMDQGLGVVQIATADRDTLEYISSNRAIKAGALEIVEVSEGGSVNTLIVINRAESMVFLLDGEILHGAKQNRVVNSSVLLAPRSKTLLPVSCVERGRWGFVSDTFTSAEFTAPQGLRAEKARQVRASLKQNEGHTADQGQIWDRVSEYHAQQGIHSRTDSLSDLYAKKEAEFEAFIKGFEAIPEGNGMAVFFGKDLLSIDLFNRVEVYREYFPKILRGIAAEIFQSNGKRGGVSEAEGSYRTLDFLDHFEGLELEEFPGVGVGREKRFDLPGMTGFELGFEGRMVHLAALKGERQRRTRQRTV